MTGDALVVGESVLDLVSVDDGTTAEHPGGSAVNAAVALARLGRPVRLATALAEDRAGAAVTRHLREAGVVLATAPGSVERTATARATLDEQGAAAYDVDVTWALGPLPDGPPPRVVHVCSLGAVLEPGAADVVALVRRLRPVATVTYDVNARPGVTGTGPEVVAAVDRVAALADLVKASDEDVAALWPELGEEEAVARLLALGPAAVVVTRGAGGAAWTDRRGTVAVPAEPARVVDTIGAGDTFAAALVDAWWAAGRLGADRRAHWADVPRDEVAAALGHAVRAAAVTVSRPGADPPYRHEVDR